MTSTKYPCYDNPVHIPGVPGTFSSVIVEVDDATREVLAITALDGSPLPDPSQPSIPKEEAKAPSDTPKNKES